MKRILNLAIVFAVILMLVGCGDDVVLDAPDVTYTVSATDEGGTLVLEWVLIADADGYYIYADGAVIDTVTTNTYNATIPAAEYSVSAYAGEDESGLTDIDCAPVVTPSLDVWDTDEPPPNPSGFGFNTSGTAVAYAVSDTTNWTFINYIIHGGTTTEFWSPHHNGYNDEVNVTKNSGNTDFDALDIADVPGGYTSPTAINSDAVYYFFIDPTDNGWDDATDNFGKIKIEAIDGDKVTMKLAFQPIAGLRWCVTD